MKHNSWMMLICCLGPLLFFIVAPALGANNNATSWIYIVPAILCFLMMIMMFMGSGCGKGGANDKDKKKDDGDSSCH